LNIEIKEELVGTTNLCSRETGFNSFEGKMATLSRLSLKLRHLSCQWVVGSSGYDKDARD